MSDERSEVERNAKSDMEQSDPSQIHNAVADPSNDPMSSPIFKLNIDAFEEWFEWLSLAELLSLRQTCKRLKQVVNYFIKTNYPAVKIGFRAFLINKRSIEQFRELESARVKMIKEVSVYNNKLTQQDVNVFREIWPQIENLNIVSSQFQFDIYETILKWCSSLKYLCITADDDSPLGRKIEWLHRQYPKMKHIRIVDGGPFTYPVECPELRTFFELNPNIQTFSTTSNVIRANRNCFLASNIQIGRLIISFDHSSLGIIEVYDILHQLHEKGFYKRLHLMLSNMCNQRHMDRIASTRGMEKLYLFDDLRGKTVPQLPDLRELCLYLLDGDTKYLDSVAKTLINVERVCVYQAKTEAIIPFMRYAPKLKEINIKCLEGGVHFKNGIIDVSALNKERKGLAGARKVTIYVNEENFLSTKFAKSQTEFSLVTLKRTAAVTWTRTYQ